MGTEHEAFLLSTLPGVQHKTKEDDIIKAWINERLNQKKSPFCAVHYEDAILYRGA